MNLHDVIERLDREWDTDGFLGHVRLGEFTPAGGADFLKLLKEIDLEDAGDVPKRLLSLLWYLPSFLAWQRERVTEKGNNVAAYDHFVTEVQNTLEIVLGIP